MKSRLLPYMRGIDGLRALAVLAVLVYHANAAWLPGGFLGVELFFVISGYLITAGLLAEWRERGSIDLPRFWLRRARRLLPAVGVLIVATLSFEALFLPSELSRLRGDALASAGYVTNWYLILAKQPYFEAFGRPSLLLHLWSLAVEEQFYLVWPLLLTLALRLLRRPRYVFPLVVCLATASTAWMTILHQHGADISRLYYGTDTRAGGLLVGAALAIVWPPTPAGRRLRWFARAPLELVGVGALSGLAYLFWRLGELDPRLYEGGFALVALLGAGLIATLAREGSWLGRLVGAGPLRWLGLRSYSIYLWHWPVFELTRPAQDVPLDGLPLFALRLALTLALASLSYRYVEQPVRNGTVERGLRAAREGRIRLSSWRHAVGLTAAAGTVAAFIGLSAAVVEARPALPPPYLSVASLHTILTAPQDPPAAPVDATPTPAPASGSGPVAATAEPSADGQPAPDAPDATTQPAPPDPSLPTSSAVTSVLPPPVAQDVPLPPPASVANVQLTAIGDSVLLGAASELVRDFGSVDIDAAVGRQAGAALPLLRDRAAAGTLSPVVLLHLGNNGTFAARDFDAIMSLLADRRQVLVVNDKVPRPWETPNNAMLAALVPSYPNAVLVDWHSVSADRPDFFYDDSIHLKPLGARVYADLIASYLN